MPQDIHERLAEAQALADAHAKAIPDDAHRVLADLYRTAPNTTQTVRNTETGLAWLEQHDLLRIGNYTATWAVVILRDHGRRVGRILFGE